MMRENRIDFPKCGFVVTDEDITALRVDCVVNAANKTLLGGGGVDGAIHRAAGPELLAECRGLGGCQTGEAKLTKGYRLSAKYVIHTVGPIYGLDDDALLERCYWNCMELARAENIHSIAFPAISTGVYRFPKVEAANIAVGTLLRWKESHAEYPIYITLSCFDRQTWQCACDLLCAEENRRTGEK